MSSLIFIDTNVLLDFYRSRGMEKGPTVLRHVVDNLDHFITTAQVEVEFKKNRQAVILQAVSALKGVDMRPEAPAFLAESKPLAAAEKAGKQIRDWVKQLKKRATAALVSPTTKDPVYQSAQKLFRAESAWNLTRDHDKRDEIRELALKRFYLGYPPRKKNDTSIGDAINWEWIVRCGSESGQDVIIVSRDSDFGVSFDGKSVINDWLGEEFRQRAKRKPKKAIQLTSRLSDALQIAGLPVSQEEVEEEERFLERRVEDTISVTDSLTTELIRGARPLSMEEFLRHDPGDDD